MRAGAMAIALASAMLLATSDAGAQEEGEPSPPRERPRGIGPIAGVTFGQWMGVPITRVPIGLDVVHQPRGWDAAVAAHAFIAPGRTENGLGAHRGEIAFGLSTAPALVRFGGGVHVAYAMLERTTVREPFVKALFGNIGGVGLGVHALLEGTFRIDGNVHGTFGVRGSVDLYDGGTGYEGGPFVGVRF